MKEGVSGGGNIIDLAEYKKQKAHQETIEKKKVLEKLLVQVLEEVRKMLGPVSKDALEGADDFTIEQFPVLKIHPVIEVSDESSIIFTIKLAIKTSKKDKEGFPYSLKSDNYVNTLIPRFEQALQEKFGKNDKVHYTSNVVSKANRLRSAIRITFKPEQLPSQFE